MNLDRKKGFLRKNVFLPALLLLFFIVSCQKQLPDGLVLLPGAKATRAYSLKGVYRLEYQVEEKYPATEALKKLSEELKKKGWKPLTHFFVYPESETSELTGWIYYRDPPKAPAWMVYAWSGDWEDAQHNIVSYTLRYSDPIQKYNKDVFVLKPDNHQLIVTAIHMPAEAAIKLREQKKRPK
jgi:hypothetical protein